MRYRLTRRSGEVVNWHVRPQRIPTTRAAPRARRRTRSVQGIGFGANDHRMYASCGYFRPPKHSVATKLSKVYPLSVRSTHINVQFEYRTLKFWYRPPSGAAGMDRAPTAAPGPCGRGRVGPGRRGHGSNRAQRQGRRRIAARHAVTTAGVRCLLERRRDCSERSGARRCRGGSGAGGRSGACSRGLGGARRAPRARAQRRSAAIARRSRGDRGAAQGAAAGTRPGHARYRAADGRRGRADVDGNRADVHGAGPDRADVHVADVHAAKSDSADVHASKPDSADVHAAKPDSAAGRAGADAESNAE